MSAHPLLVPERMLHRPGLVGIPCGEQARWTEFTQSVMVLERPTGTQLAFVYGAYIQANREDLVRQMLETGAAWLFMVDDDHIFDRKLLINLLDRRVPVVGALALARKPPYFICAFSETDSASGLSKGVPMHGFEFEMQEVAAVGTGAILIRREVFEAIEPPWFTSGSDERGVNVSEDVVFCEKARNAGFDVWLDGTQSLGHLTGVTLSLDARGIVFDLGNEESIVIPMEQVEEVIPTEDVADPVEGDESDSQEPTEAAETDVPIVIGASGLTGRIPVVRQPDDPEKPVDVDDDGNPIFAQAPAPGVTIPARCLRKLTSLRVEQCDPSCPGHQRDGGCLAEIVRTAQAQGVEWSFEIDPENYWIYNGQPLG